MDTTIYLIIFLPLILYLIFQRRDQKLMAHQIMSRKKGRTQMLELAKKFIDKKCIIYTFDHSQIVGILRQVSDSGVLVEGNSAVEAVNLDFIVRIREYPRNKKGKEKSLILD